jgi:hypothetical protein
MRVFEIISPQQGTAFVPVSELRRIVAVNDKRTVELIFRDFQAKITTKQGREKRVATILLNDVETGKGSVRVEPNQLYTEAVVFGF